MLSNLGEGHGYWGVFLYTIMGVFLCVSINSKNVGVVFWKKLGLQTHRFLKAFVCRMLRFECHRNGGVLSSFMLIMFHSVSEGFAWLYSEVFPYISFISSIFSRFQVGIQSRLFDSYIKSNKIKSRFCGLETPKSCHSKTPKIYEIKTPTSHTRNKKTHLQS